MDFKLSWHLAQACERKVVLWGTGEIAISVYKNLILQSKNLAFSMGFFVSKEHNELEAFHGYPVHSKEKISYKEHYIIIATQIYADEVETELKDLGFEAGKDYYNPFSSYLPYAIFIQDAVSVYWGKNTAFNNQSIPLMLIEKWLKYMGAFTCIAPTAAFGADHSMYYITTGAIENIANLDVLKEYQYDIAARNTYINIGNDVWIGANAFINCSKCHNIGDGAIIGSGAIVLDDVPPYAIVVGTPAKVLKYRFTPKEIEILLRVKWWEWDNNTIYENTDLLVNPKMFFEKFR